MKTNYHTHTPRCHHAHGSEEEYVLAAIEAGFEELGFSDHTPWIYDSDFVPTMRMNIDELDNYIDTIRALKEKYKDQISIKVGLECEYFPTKMEWLKNIIQTKQLDYVILGHHFKDSDEFHIYYGTPTHDVTLLKTYVDTAIQAMDTGLYTYMAHPDVMNFIDIHSNDYIQEMTRLCIAAKQRNIPLEYNLLGLISKRHYPNPVFWKIASNIGCKVIIGVDCHETYQMGLKEVYNEAIEYLEKELKMERIETIPFFQYEKDV